MKTFLLSFVIAASFYQPCYGQADSVLLYLNKVGMPTTKDSAFRYSAFTKNNALWHGRVYYINTKVLQSEGDYGEMNCVKPVGTFHNYKEDGTLASVISYTDSSKPAELTFYYKNGNKKSYASLNGKDIKEQKGWDESGKEIPGYIAFKEPSFKGGNEAWIKYLDKNLDGNVPIDAGAPVGEYIVDVEFTVNKDGSITNVKAVTVPALCKPCGAEAVSVVINGPAWQPAIDNNEPVNFRLRQKITFRVTDKKKKG